MEERATRTHIYIFIIYCIQRNRRRPAFYCSRLHTERSQRKAVSNGSFSPSASGNSLSKPELTAADRISSGRTLPDLIMILKETSSCPEMLSDDRKL